jgi:hypothetical protein
LLAKKALLKASTHASRHTATGEDPIAGLISPQTIGPYRDAPDYLFFKTTAKDGSTLVNHAFIPEAPDAGYIGVNVRRFRCVYARDGDFSGGVSVGGMVTAGRFYTLDDVFFVGYIAPTTEGSLRYDGLAKRLKFHDGTAARTIAWLDPDVLGGINPDILISYIINNTAIILVSDGARTKPIIICYPTSYTDLSITHISGMGRYYPRSPWGRTSNVDNGYFLNLNTGATTADFELRKIVNGTETLLGTEAVDLEVDAYYTLKLRCSGTTIQGFRTDMGTPKISVTDTSFSSGYWGAAQGDIYNQLTPRAFHFLTSKKAAATLPPPKPLAHFEVPIVGEGTTQNPFKPALPVETFEFETPRKKLYESLRAKGFTDEEIFSLYGLTADFIGNRLAVSYAALIPSEKTGKPTHATALISISPQPDRNPNLHPLTRCLEALEDAGASKLKPVEAKRLAKQIDDRLREGELEYMVNPTEENELWSLTDFYEREVIDEERIKPEEIPNFTEILKGYAEKSEKIGRKDLAQKFSKIIRKS